MMSCDYFNTSMMLLLGINKLLSMMTTEGIDAKLLFGIN